MDQLSPEMKAIAGILQEQSEEKQSKANMLALISATLQYFIDLIMDEVDRAGFVTIEFLEKVIFFLRATTPSYSEEKYRAILSTLIDVDARFADTEFYHGLESMRKISTAQTENLDVIQGTFKIVMTLDLKSNSELTFYTTYLIENTISYISRLRMSKDSLNMDNRKLKKIIDARYDNCVIQTVVMLEDIQRA